MSTSALFQPIKVGDLDLQHRIVLAPLTRCRANPLHEHGDLALEYYTQRATPGALLITEATLIAPQAGGLPSVPGIWSDAQVAAWKKIVDAVHAKGAYIVLQLWAIGRAAYTAVLEGEGGFPLVSASDIPMDAQSAAPRPLTVDEIKEYVGWYKRGAENAVHKAGFDGVEIHDANGFLLDQFVQDVSNNRTDEYGGSLENRLRFTLEVVEAVVGAVGEKRTAIRLSPWSRFQGMRMADPVPTFSTLVTKIRDTYPEFAYLHVIEGRVMAHSDDPEFDATTDTTHFLREIWGKRPYITAGGFKGESAAAIVEKEGGLVAFGRDFIANPDLPSKLKNGAALTKYDRDTFYSPGPVGYTDYPFAEVAA